MIQVQFAVCVPAHWRTLAGVQCDDVDFCWLPIEAAPANTDRLIEDWLSRERLTCCDFQGGYLITHQGTLWNDGMLDEYWMALSWLSALEQMIKGATKTMAYPWEESQLMLERSGDQLTLYENDHQKHGLCSPITVPFNAFVQQMADQSQQFAVWLHVLHKNIQQRQPDPALLNTHLSSAHTQAEKLVKIQQEMSARCIDQAETFVQLVKAQTGGSELR